MSIGYLVVCVQEFTYTRMGKRDAVQYFSPKEIYWFTVLKKQKPCKGAMKMALLV